MCVVWCLSVIVMVSSHSDHVPSGLLPGSPGPWEKFEETDTEVVRSKDGKTVESIRMPRIRPTKVRRRLMR